MTVEEAIVSRLRDAASVTALVGAGDEARISRHTRDQDPDALPAVTYQGTGLEEIVSLDGPTGAGRMQVQIDCWAADGDTADALAIAVTAALRTGDAIGINAAFRQSKAGAVQDPEVAVWRVRMAWDVHYSAALAA